VTESETDAATAVRAHVDAFNARDLENLIATGDRVACELTETLTANGEERTFSIAGFYRAHEGFIAAAKIYREGGAELA
jgi:hypothetical protein